MSGPVVVILVAFWADHDGRFAIREVDHDRLVLVSLLHELRHERCLVLLIEQYTPLIALVVVWHVGVQVGNRPVERLR